MGKLGQSVERAFREASGSMAGLALMLERKQGSPTMLRIIAGKLEKAAATIREAADMETERQSNGQTSLPS